VRLGVPCQFWPKKEFLKQDQNQADQFVTTRLLSTKIALFFKFDQYVMGRNAMPKYGRNCQMSIFSMRLLLQVYKYKIDEAL
jgi:hypothetical protein